MTLRERSDAGHRFLRSCEVAVSNRVALGLPRFHECAHSPCVSTARPLRVRLGAERRRPTSTRRAASLSGLRQAQASARGGREAKVDCNLFQPSCARACARFRRLRGRTASSGKQEPPPSIAPVETESEMRAAASERTELDQVSRHVRLQPRHRVSLNDSRRRAEVGAIRRATAPERNGGIAIAAAQRADLHREADQVPVRVQRKRLR